MPKDKVLSAELAKGVCLRSAKPLMSRSAKMCIADELQRLVRNVCTRQNHDTWMFCVGTEQEMMDLEVRFEDGGWTPFEDESVQRKEKTPPKVAKKRKQAGTEAGGGTGTEAGGGTGTEAGGGTGTEENSGRATKTKKKGKVVKKKKESGKVTYMYVYTKVKCWLLIYSRSNTCCRQIG